MSQGIFAHWPNRITGLRFVGAVLLFALLSARGEVEPVTRGVAALAFWLFVATASTDFLDGWLARRGGQVTAFGRIADPFVDKILVLGAMIYLAVLPWSREWFPAWIVVTILAREILVTAIRGYAESVGLAFPADWFGKFKMVAQCGAIATVLGVFAFDWSDGARRWVASAGHVCVWVTLLASVGSGLSYVFKIRVALAQAR